MMIDSILLISLTVLLLCSNSSEERPLLLPLVKPELTGLANFWLAALKDHALLSLPTGKRCNY